MGLRETLEAATDDWPNELERVQAQDRLAALAPELAALVLDMGAWIDYALSRLDVRWTTPESGTEAGALLARLDQLGKEPSDG